MNKKLDLIVIDDDRVIQMQIQQFLEGVDINYEFYSCPEEGFSRLQENGAVICILDYMMPKMTGEELAVKFSEQLLFEKGDMYLYTSKEFNDEERFKMMTLGFKAILQNPMTKEEFLNILDDHGLLNKSLKAA